MTTVTDNNSYKEIMQFLVGDNISEFEWIFRRYPFVVNILSDNTIESGGTALFTVKLDSEPSANVTIPISSDNVSEGTVSVSSLTFTSTNWASEQTVTVTGVDDSVVDDNVTYNIVIGPTSSSDVNYDGLEIVDLLLTNSNDDYLSDGLNWSEAISSAEFSGRSGFSSLAHLNSFEK